METLRELGLKYRTDKMKPYLSHLGLGYMEGYERHFATIRDTVTSVLEIGVRFGNSLPIWRDYFPKAMVYGLDCNEDCAKLTFGDRVKITIGHQEDSQILADLIKLSGGFDIVIDDGSHLVEHQLKSLEVLLPAVRAGGIYAIEDLSCSYMEDIGRGMVRGGWFYKYLGTDPDTVHNHRADFDSEILSVIKNLDHLTGDVKAVHFYTQLCILEK